MDLTGRTLLGKYQIEGLLGHGGMGAVWTARHALTGRKLAIKTLDESYLDNKQVVQRFGREARAASSVQHPGIVEVLDLDRTEDGIPFLVMEYLEGETLARRIERRGRLDQEELVRIGMMLLEALEAAHSHGVIHRDLKPENIYVVPAGRRGEIVKILDFGISHKRDEQGDKLTMTGSVLGTPHYMSPEQAMGEAELDLRADLYACGVVLYECAVGDVPFDAPNYNKLLRTILDNAPVPPRRRGAQISEEVERLILWAMEKERDRRISTATDMLTWLEKSARGERPPYDPSTATGLTLPPPAKPGSGKKTTPAGAVAPVAAPAGSLPAFGASPLAPRAGGTLGDGDLTVKPASWRPAPMHDSPSSDLGLDFADSPKKMADLEGGAKRSARAISTSQRSGATTGELELDLPSPKASGEHRVPASLEIDERALRGSSSGSMPAVEVPSVRPPPAVPPRSGNVSGNYQALPMQPIAKQEPPAWGRWILYGGGALLLFAGLVLGIRYVVNPGVDDRTISPPVDAPIREPNTPQVQRPDFVSIRIEGLPPNARIMLDGLPARAPIRMRRGGTHELVISAPGYVDRHLTFNASQSQILDADLRPAGP